MNIYIAGLSYRTNDADLTNLFAEFGEVSSAKLLWIEKLVTPEDSLSWK